MKILTALALTVTLAGYGVRVLAQDWPEGLSFVGLKEGTWQLYVVPKGATQPRRISTVSEPRTPVFHRASGRVAYIAADGSLHERSIDVDNDILLLKPNAERAYTQPAYDPAGDRLYVVELKEGVSVDTDIVVLDKSRTTPKFVVTQRLAQFEPVLTTSNNLYYSNVLCTLGCGKIIQEIWHMNVVSGVAEQVTLVNAVARHPALSSDGQWLYFSSNKAGNYHLWRMALKNSRYEQLTRGTVTDLSPGVDAGGKVYFIRRSTAQAQLMRLDSNGELSVVPLPAGVDDVRDLEVDS